MKQLSKVEVGLVSGGLGIPLPMPDWIPVIPVPTPNYTIVVPIKNEP